jgi:single-stranded-DNA-specific exonuclease
MHRRWLVKRTNPEYIGYISKAASISPALSQILINRGIKTLNEIHYFLNPKISDLSDPFELSGVKAAVERIIQAIKKNETVLIHGDYDTDGVTATAIMVQALKTYGIVVHYFIPNRILHGYGFNPVSIDIAKKLGATLIITVDCGITAFETAAYAKQNRIDVIITDHHEPIRSAEERKLGSSEVISALPLFCSSALPSYLLPDAVAVINPKISPPNSELQTPSYNLSGAGVAFKIVQALSTIHDSRFTIHDLLDLTAIGTMADVVPLTGENRVIVKEGLRLINEGQRLGIKALKGVSGLNDKELRSGLLSFTIIPRINAAGRIADARDVVHLLLSDIESETSNLSVWLDGLNLERQQTEEKVYREALSMIDPEQIPSVIVLSGEGWHQGVVGIVASRIAEEFHRPTFILSVENGIAKGSARSIPSFDICKGLSECSDLLLSFGGHKQAAGVKLNAENIRDFKDMIIGILNSNLTEDNLIPSIEIDANIALNEANHNLLKELSMLEPLGYGNESPLLGSKRLEVINPRVVGNNHLKMRLKQGHQSIDAIAFDMGDIHTSDIIDAAYTLNLNEYNGNSYLQLNLKAIRPSQ